MNRKEMDMYGRTQNRRNQQQQFTQGQGFQGQIDPRLLQVLQGQQQFNPLLQGLQGIQGQQQFNPLLQQQGYGMTGLSRGQRRQIRRMLAAQQAAQFGINPFVPTQGFAGQQGVWQGPWQQAQGVGGFGLQGGIGGLGGIGGVGQGRSRRRRNRNRSGVGVDVRGQGGNTAYGQQTDLFAGDVTGGGSRRSRRRGRRGDTAGLSGQGRNDFTGRGPRNYRRDDTQIQDDVCEILARHPRIDASDIEVAVRNGEVTLRGNVIDRQMKLLAERVIDQVPGVVDIYNEVRVARETTTSAGTGFAPVSNNNNGNRRTQETSHRTS